MPSLSKLRDELQLLQKEASIFEGLGTDSGLSPEQRLKLVEIRERIKAVQEMLSASGTSH